MKFSSLAFTGLAGALGLALASQAAANTVTVTYDGVIDATQTINKVVLPAPDYDVSNLFGGGNLEGEAFTAVVTYDTSVGAQSKSATYNRLAGGPAFDNQATGQSYASPIDSITFTINGYSYSFTPDYSGVVRTQSGASGYVEQSAESLDGSGVLLHYDTNLAPSSLNYSFAADNSIGYGYFLSAFDSNNNSDNLQFVLLDVVVSAAPEPSSWALMLVGAGLCGWSLRRRTRTQVA